MLETYLISVAVKSTVLLLAGLLCVRLLRHQDASVRHLVCLTALASAAVVPLLALWSRQWTFLISVPTGSVVGFGGGKVGTAPWEWPMALAAMWALGALAMAFRAICGLVALSRARGRAEYFKDEDGAGVWIGNVSFPLTCGVLRPLILLPPRARDWDDQRLRAVLLHESAHVRRGDCLAKYVAQGSRALLWWNPVAWTVAKRLNHEQELACDDAVLSAGVPAEAYATVLLDVARECSSPWALGCAMGASNSAAVLRERFTHLFEGRREATRSGGEPPSQFRCFLC